jgi:arylsulfatase A-like enzyme
MVVTGRGWILLAALMLLAPVCNGKPNVILVLTDDQGFGDLGRHGNPVLKTPELDRFGESAVRFDRFFVSPTCAPTRAALLTGQHEFAVGVSHTIMGRNLLRPGAATLPEVLGAAGYATGIFGKWHLGENFPCRPQDRGFQEVLIHGGGGIGQTPDRWGNRYESPVLQHNGTWTPYSGYCTDIFFREATTWMQAQVTARKPFFLYLATNAAHAPFAATPEDAKRYLDAGIAPELANFYGMLANLDRNFGALMQAVDASGAARDTIVIFMSDNGSALGAFNAGMSGTKGSAREGGVRVPCFIRWPEKLKPRNVSEIAAHVDLLPTLAGWCGAALPDGWTGAGVDLGSALLNEKPLPRDRALVTHAGRWPGEDSPAQHRFRNYSVRDNQFRLVGLALYDLHADPGEAHDVFAGHPDVVSRLTTTYGKWWESVAPSLQLPVRYLIGSEEQPQLALTAHDWWPPRDVEKSVGAATLWSQPQVRGLLEKLANPAARQQLTSVTGRWFLQAARDGHYKVTLRLLPPEAGADEVRALGRLRSGKAHVRVNREEVIVDVLDGASAISVGIDVEAGELDLEAWFDGQLPAPHVLGAMFVTIERVGERKRTLRPEIRPAGEP